MRDRVFRAADRYCPSDKGRRAPSRKLYKACAHRPERRVVDDELPGAHRSDCWFGALRPGPLAKERARVVVAVEKEDPIGAELSRETCGLGADGTVCPLADPPYRF